MGLPDKCAAVEFALERLEPFFIATSVAPALFDKLQQTVTQRMKRSGQRWSVDGGQAVLTFRALAQSERFDAPWKLVSAEYRRDISFPENVVPLPARRASV